MRVFETFFPAGVVRTGAGFSGAGWVLGGERHCVPGVPTLDPRLNSPGIRMTSSKKARQESKAPRDFLSPQRISSERCNFSTHKGNWTC